jgi:type III pantothenate kinase
VSHVIVSTVGPETADLGQGQSEWLRFNYTTPVPITNLYASKETLGLDRLAAVCGAWSIFPGKNILSIDMGTCITYDFLTNKDEYLGGAISPGLQMRFKAMHTFTAKLPLIESQAQMEEQHIGIHNFENLIGRNTLDSMRAGAIRGMLLEINGFIESYQRIYPDLQCLICGGDAALFDTEHKNSIFARADLVAEGLNTILNYNVQK